MRNRPELVVCAVCAVCVGVVVASVLKPTNESFYQYCVANARDVVASGTSSSWACSNGGALRATGLRAKAYETRDLFAFTVVRANSGKHFIGILGTWIRVPHILILLPAIVVSTSVFFYRMDKRVTAVRAIPGALLSQNRPSGELVEEAVLRFVALTLVGLVSAAVGLDLRKMQMYVIFKVAVLGLKVARLFTGMDLKKSEAFLFGLFVVVDSNAIIEINDRAHEDLPWALAIILDDTGHDTARYWFAFIEYSLYFLNLMLNLLTLLVLMVGRKSK
ncbi:unnamed product [Ostreococcus tauri]|uniref:Unnamed product n=1 Tax=Ostreococcus tauri TaxID=70448 RepID=Q01AY9_OSTTA|nr:unnamed product [Ostreococcus tauri]CAL51659.1 unnamed product [Ostreococcus tauri]|eukprot:XP_003078779.1 unnamed product [Ostreococcus tauri]